MAGTAASERADDSEGRHGDGGELGGLSHTFHEKVISLDTMELRLLLPTAVAIALLVGGAALLATRDLDWPQLSEGRPDGSLLVTVPLPVAVLTAITLVFAWSAILTGALHAHLALRVLGVGVYAVLGVLSAVEADSIWATPMIAIIVLSVIAAAVGLYVTDRGNHHQAPHLHHRARLRLPTFGWVLLATALIYALLALAGVRTGRMAEFIDLQLSLFQFALIPVLLLAGTDFAEWSEVVAGRAGSLIGPLPRPAVLAVSVVAAALALGWAYLVRGGRPGLSPGEVAGDLVPVAILAVPVGAAVVVALRRPLSVRVPFWALAAGAGVLYLGILGSAVAGLGSPGGQSAATSLPLVAEVGDGDPSYTLVVPQSWRETPVPGGRAWSGLEGGRPATVVLLWGPGRAGTALASAVGAPAALTPAGASDGWRGTTVTTSLRGEPVAGQLWTRREDGRQWRLVELRAGSPTADSRTLFAIIRQSWAPEAGAEESGETSPSDFGPQYNVIWVGAAVIVLLGLGVALLLRGSGEVATGGLFLTLSALFAAGGHLVATRVFELLGAGAAVPVVTTRNLLVAGACATLGVVLLTSSRRWHAADPILRLVLVLLLGLAGLEILYDGVFSTALSAGERFGLAQGLVLLAAMLWDILMSGESFTNAGGLAVPRHTRVLLYLGYTLLVVTTVVFLSAERVQGGGGAGDGFESDFWPQLGIAALGPPLLLTFLVANLAAWRRSGTRAEAGVTQVDRSVLEEVPAGGR